MISASVLPPPTSTRTAIALALVAVLVYANAAGNGFVLDDRGIIVENPLVRNPATVWRAFLTSYWPPGTPGGQYRPLGIVSFAIDRALAGSAPTWSHLVNLGWHAGVVLLVYRLALCLLAPVGAAAAALVFAIHPVHVEAVANVVGRLELMAAAFGLAALLAHRKRSWTAPVLYLAALFSKESAVMIPVLAALWDTLQPDTNRTRFPRAHFVAYAGVTVLWLALMFTALHGAPVGITSAAFHDQGVVGRQLTVLSVVPHYLRLLVAPVTLSSDYEPDVIVPATAITTMVVVGAVIVAAWVVLVARAWRRAPVVAFAAAWIPIALAPVSNVLFATGVVLAERTLYLPSVGAALLVGWMADQLVVPHRVLGAAAAVAICAALSARTWTRTPVWRDARSHALALLASHPESYRGHWVAGRVLRAANQLDGAEREYALARQIFPGDVALLDESASLANQLGREAHARALDDSANTLRIRRRGDGGPQ